MGKTKRENLILQLHSINGEAVEFEAESTKKIDAKMV